MNQTPGNFQPGAMLTNPAMPANGADHTGRSHRRTTRESRQPNATAHRPLRVLLYEDNAADVELALWALASAGFEVTSDVVVTPGAVLERIRETAYDVILSDYRVPNATGMDVFRSLKAEGITVPFILVTGSLGDEAAVECLKEGVADYVLKDRLARLPVAVHRALEERRLEQLRVEAEEALRISEASYRSLVESAPCGILRVSAVDGHFLEVNGALAEMLGYNSPAELLSRWGTVHLAMDAETCARARNECAPHHRVGDIDIEWKRKDGSPCQSME